MGRWQIPTRLGIAAGLLLAADAAAGIINVPGDQPTIQAGIDAAADGDEVVVADGVYTGPGNREVQTGTKLIIIRSAGGPDVCVIDCEGVGRAFVISGGAQLEGFTIRNGQAVHGGGMLIGGNATIVACVFAANTADAGGAAYVLGSSPTFISCTFTGNCAQVVDGGAIYNLYGSPTFVNCLMTANSATAFGGAVFSDLATLDLVNCTLSDNSAFRGAGITNYAGVEMTLSNCILWGNQDFEGRGLSAQILSTSSTETVNYTCVEGLDDAFGGEGNIGDEPLFLDPTSGDYRLGPGSPCIDAADSNAVPVGITTDLDGNPRFIDDPATPDTGNGVCHVDMGAYEFQQGTAVCCPGDINGDGTTNVLDLIDLLLCFGLPAVPGCEAQDINTDGTVNVLDLIQLLLAFGNACP